MSQIPAAPAAQPTEPAADPKRKDRRLGRGLASLITMPAIPSAAGQGGSASPLPGMPPAADPVAVMNLYLTQIAPNPAQPRRDFNEQALANLADSLKANGVLQPVVVRRRAAAGQPGEAKFELVAGERRWRAARLAGLESIPAVVKTLSDDMMLELSLVENIQRADLNPMERAEGYHALMGRLAITQDALARRLGESRGQVNGHLRLLDLPDPVKEFVRQGKLSFGHARVIAGLKQPATQIALAEAIVQREVPVREVERLVAEALEKPNGEEGLRVLIGRLMASVAGKPMPPDPMPPAPAKPSNIVALEEKLTRRLGTRVAIHQGRRADMGKVVIDFYCLDDFDRILEALGVTAD